MSSYIIELNTVVEVNVSTQVAQLILCRQGRLCLNQYSVAISTFISSLVSPPPPLSLSSKGYATGWRLRFIQTSYRFVAHPAEHSDRQTNRTIIQQNTMLNVLISRRVYQRYNSQNIISRMSTYKVWRLHEDVFT